MQDVLPSFMNISLFKIARHKNNGEGARTVITISYLHSNNCKIIYHKYIYYKTIKISIIKKIHYQ